MSELSIPPDFTIFFKTQPEIESYFSFKDFFKVSFLIFLSLFLLSLSFYIPPFSWSSLFFICRIPLRSLKYWMCGRKFQFLESTRDGILFFIQGLFQVKLSDFFLFYSLSLSLFTTADLICRISARSLKYWMCGRKFQFLNESTRDGILFFIQGLLQVKLSDFFSFTLSLFAIASSICRISARSLKYWFWGRTFTFSLTVQR